MGDSGAFIDPVFSSGVFLAMNAACLGAAAVDGALRNPAAEPALMRQYEKTVHRGLRTMSWFIYRFTSPVLHRMFMHPSNRFRMEQAVISMLSGDVFSKSPVRYSLAMFKVVLLPVCAHGVASCSVCLALPAQGYAADLFTGDLAKGSGRVEERQLMQQQGSSVLHHHDFPVPLSVEPVSAAKLPALLQRDDVLMTVNFSGMTAIDREDPRLVHAGLRALGTSAAVEVWRGAGPVSCHRKGRISWSENGDVLFGHLLLEETAADDLAELIAAAYTEINTFLHASAYPHVFRFWHYIPGINRVDNGIERYQAFCVGRYSALSEQHDFERALPAASAVGTDVPGLLISFASGKVRPLQVENPRQVSAFHYPPVHGPRSPLFSRAACMSWHAAERQLFLSGTASIVGHETLHGGDVIAQAGETCRNIAAVLEAFARYPGEANASRSSASSLRVYLRHPDHLESVAGILNSKPDLPGDIIYLQGDLCRAELLLEIEGVFDLAGGAVPG